MNQVITPTPANQAQTKSLAKACPVVDNMPTTKQQAVQPSRYPLAIFTPSCYALHGKHSIGVFITSSLDTYKSKSSSVYGGLIRPNTIAFMVNKSSRLVAVVETCQPLFGLVSLTKQQGVFA